MFDEADLIRIPRASRAIPFSFEVVVWHLVHVMRDERKAPPSAGPGVVRRSLVEHLVQLMGKFNAPADPQSGGGEGDDGEPKRGGHGEPSKWTSSELDVGAWVPWMLAGLHLFSGDAIPKVSAVSIAARRVLLLAAIERFEGNITKMADALGTSRRWLREQLKATGLYAEGAPSSQGRQL